MRYVLLVHAVATLGCNRSKIPNDSTDTLVSDSSESGIRVRTYTDPRDSTLYPTIGYSGKLWLANELYFKTPNARCYNDAKECGEYGRMYSFEEAKSACPAGWHLPSEEEWRGLIEVDGGYYDLPAKKALGDPKSDHAGL